MRIVLSYLSHADCEPTELIAFDRVVRHRQLESARQRFGAVHVLTAWDDPFGPPLVVMEDGHVGVGRVRLHNRTEVAHWAGAAAPGSSDLALAARCVARHGERLIPAMLGEFAFVVWNPEAGSAVAACDAFALNKLYYSSHAGIVVIASRAEVLAVDETYDVQYLAGIVGNCVPARGETVYRGVQALPSASLAEVSRNRVVTRAYWSPAAQEPDTSLEHSERAAVAMCRELFEDAVRVQLDGSADGWLQLSGGVDSSSVASVAQSLAQRGVVRRGVAGSITYVDRQGTSTDEREYADSVLRAWNIPNVAIVDPPLWYDERYAPPETDLPDLFLPFSPRERQTTAIVRGNGGRVLLTGQGGDELFTGTMLFFADWIARGHLWAACAEMIRRAAIGRASFWELAYRNALLPLLPKRAQGYLIRDEGRIPPWVREDAIQRFGLRERSFVAATLAGERGDKYRHAVAQTVLAIGSATEFGVLSESLELRHPFLYRPLVEFALRLPPSLCARPQARKWILREAMRGLLPEVVRQRIGKASPSTLYAHSLIDQRALLQPLVRESMLADLGIVDGARLRAAFDEVPHAPQRRDELHAALQATLATEAWLQIRSGRWPLGGHFRSTGSNAVSESFPRSELTRRAV